MTTLLYKRWEYVASDDRATGWMEWISRIEKIFFYAVWDYRIYVLCAGWVPFKEQMKSLIKTLFDDEWEFNAINLYDYREECKKYYKENYEHVIVIRHLDRDWDCDSERAFILNDVCLEEINSDFYAAWSGGSYAYAYMQLVSQEDPYAVMKYAASRDSSTSENVLIKYFIH